MGTARRLVSLGSGCALGFLALQGPAIGALSQGAQRCIDQYNNALRQVSQQAGKSARSCIKDAGRGRELTPDACIVNNTDGKLAGKEDRVNALYQQGTCIGTEPIQQGASNGSAAHRQAVTDLAHDLFGDPVGGVIAPGVSEAKCQDAAMRRGTQLFTAAVKEHRSCKKSGMTVGAVVDAGTLETLCMTPSIPDPHNQIFRKAALLTSNIESRCTGLALATLFPGLEGECHGTPAALASCVERATFCSLCSALNAADGTSRDCDQFDDGAANASCGIQFHKCVLATVPSSNSQIQIHIAALPMPLTFGISGGVDLGGSGSVKTCALQQINPVTIPAIGVICITPAPGECPNGRRHCGPGAGPPLGVAMQSDANIGACTANAECQTECAATCNGPNRIATGQCTGFCSGASPAEQPCTTDTQCMPSNGLCAGPDPVAPAQNHICQCSCIDTAAYGPSDPGDAQCFLGLNAAVESASPCNGTDILIPLGAGCVPLSTQEASALITDANFIPGALVPSPPNVNHQTGSPVACATFDTSTLTGLVGVGAGNLFGTSLGDASIGVKATCN